MDAIPTDASQLLRRLEHEVHLWLSRPEEATDPGLLRSYRSLLSPDEQQRYRRFVFDTDRHHYLVAHVLLRRVLSAYVDVDPSAWQFYRRRHGRPEIAGPVITPSLRFNLTHTDGLVGCVVTRGVDCGVDVEKLSARGNPMAIAEKVFAAAERQVLKGLRGQEFLQRFFSYWTLREAYCKALGAGIAHTKRNYCFVQQDAGRWVIRLDAPASDEKDHWQFAVIKPTRQHIAALAIREDAATNKSLVQHFVVP
jgi:4'-phosphopantetheinyl transferase